jgi:hypothetical protein
MKEATAAVARIQKGADERRSKWRFGIQREMRYKLLKEDVIIAAGNGHTLDISSSGISFIGQHELPEGAFIELSVSWPVLLGDTCPMRLNVFGRVVRNTGCRTACTIDKYEFRTQARKANPLQPVRNDAMLQRWAETVRATKPLEVARAATA